MFVLDLEDEIEDLQAALGVEAVSGWAVYDHSAPQPLASEDECIERHFRAFVAALAIFPPTLQVATEARDGLAACIRDFAVAPSDSMLLRCLEAEYVLFRMMERKLCEPEIVRLFASVDDFLATAQTILQRRKARAGKSLEHHVEFLLRRAGVPFDPRVDVEGTKPDLLIPGRREYLDPVYPADKLFAVGIKTTCKDRWRQVLREAPRVRSKHILTVQKGISPAQLDEMRASSVTLVVPEGIQSDYPKDRRAELLSVAAFIDHVRSKLSS
jgi:type II restriction enzyme